MRGRGPIPRRHSQECGVDNGPIDAAAVVELQFGSLAEFVRQMKGGVYGDVFIEYDRVSGNQIRPDKRLLFPPFRQ